MQVAFFAPPAAAPSPAPGSQSPLSPPPAAGDDASFASLLDSNSARLPQAPVAAEPAPVPTNGCAAEPEPDPAIQTTDTEQTAAAGLDDPLQLGTFAVSPLPNRTAPPPLPAAVAMRGNGATPVRPERPADPLPDDELLPVDADLSELPVETPETDGDESTPATPAPTLPLRPAREGKRSAPKAVPVQAIPTGDEMVQVAVPRPPEPLAVGTQPEPVAPAASEAASESATPVVLARPAVAATVAPVVATDLPLAAPQPVTVGSPGERPVAALDSRRAGGETQSSQPLPAALGPAMESRPSAMVDSAGAVATSPNPVRADSPAPTRRAGWQQNSSTADMVPGRAGDFGVKPATPVPVAVAPASVAASAEDSRVSQMASAPIPMDTPPVARAFGNVSPAPAVAPAPVTQSSGAAMPANLDVSAGAAPVHRADRSAGAVPLPVPFAPAEAVAPAPGDAVPRGQDLHAWRNAPAPIATESVPVLAQPARDAAVPVAMPATQPAVMPAAEAVPSTDEDAPVRVAEQAGVVVRAALGVAPSVATGRTERAGRNEPVRRAWGAAPVASEMRAQSVPGATAPVVPTIKGDEATKSVAASPVTAAPTLMQVLVENTPVAAAMAVPAPKSAPRAAPVAFASVAVAQTPVAERPVSAPFAAGAEAVKVLPDAVAAMPADSADAGAAVLAEAAASSGPQGRRDSPEKLAGGRVKGGRPAVDSAVLARGRNFLSVDRQIVGKGGLGIGTGIAEGAQPMSAQTPVLPRASAALEIPESAVGAAVSGHPTAATTVKEPVVATVPRSQAAEIVREAVELAERAQAAGRNSVEVRLQSPGDESLRVHLRWHDGVVHARFVTQNTELQQALSREWERAVPQLADKGLRFGEASFENRHQSSDQSSAQNAFNFEQHRQHSRGQNQTADEQPAFTLPAQTRTAAPVPASRRGAAVAQPQTTVTPANVPGSRTLRAWA